MHIIWPSYGLSPWNYLFTGKGLQKKGKIQQKEKRWYTVSAHKKYSTLILWPAWFHWKLLFQTTPATLFCFQGV